MRLDELIHELQAMSVDGWGQAEVQVQCEGFSLIDMDSDGDEKCFDTVPITGIESAMSTNGASCIVLGRESPDVIKKRLIESGWWGAPSETTEAGVVVVPVEVAETLLKVMVDYLEWVKCDGFLTPQPGALKELAMAFAALSRLQQNGGDGQ